MAECRHLFGDDGPNTLACSWCGQRAKRVYTHDGDEAMQFIGDDDPLDAEYRQDYRRMK